MMMLVIGGSGSGKSSYAESRAEKCADSLPRAGKEESQKYYLATMQISVSDAEGRRKVARHRQLRRGKGFVTIEQPTDIHKALDKMKSGKMMAGARTALLECVSNLTANEMFSGESPKSAEQISAKIMEGVRQLNQGVAHLIVVSNNVFEDGNVYDRTTVEYLRAMGTINQGLAAMADCVVEVVAGIPLTLKTPTDDRNG